jgi:GT2 family glycosyltransferase
MTLYKEAVDPSEPMAPPASPDAGRVRVSVTIPAYKPNYLDSALQSALSQDFDDFEIVICDDSPGTEVAEIVRPYLERGDGPQLRYFRNASALGEEGNVGECIRQARGDYVKFLYDDDVLLPGCLRALAEVLDAHPEVVLATSRRTLIDERGGQLPDNGSTFSPFAGDVLVDGCELVSFLADWTLNFIGEPSSVMVRREQVLPLAGRQFSLGGQKVSWLGDLTMHVNLLRHGHLAYLAQPLSCFRISSEQTSHASRLDPHVGNERYGYFKRVIRESGWHRTQNNHLVRVAPLNTPGEAKAIDLGMRVSAMANGQDPIDSLQRWLSLRVPSPVQERLIAERFDHVGTPSIAVMVRASAQAAGDAALERTLASLLALQPGFMPRQVIVVGPSAAPAGLELSGLSHVPATARDAELQAITLAAGDCEADWLLIVDAGDEFTASGLQIVAQELAGAQGVRAVYADEMMRDGNGTLSALLRPDFNLDLLLSMPAGMARHWLFRRDLLLQAGGLDRECGEAAEFDLLLRLIEDGGIDGLAHVHEPLLVMPAAHIRTRQEELDVLARHLGNRGYEHARVEPTLPGCYRIHYGHQAAPGVSIIIPTKNQFRMLLRCIDSLIETTAYKNYEVLIVDNGSTDEDACKWLDGIEALGNPQLRVIRYPHPFNYSSMNNLAAQHARGEYLVLLNNDTAILQKDWLEVLLNHAQRPEVGVVGAKLLYPDGRIQHAGVVLGLRGPAEHPFIGENPASPGYMYRLQVDQDYSAVTGACLMVRKSLYEEVGGLDEEAFKVSYNDVDLCLKIRSAGYLVVWTPHAMLMHEGSVSQATVDRNTAEAKAKRFLGEQDAFYDKWLPAAARDPAYNQNFSLNGAAFQVQTEAQLNWRPLSWRPLPIVLASPADQGGCGHYRVIQPARAFDQLGLAEAIVSHRYLSPVEMERLAPDTLVLQRQMTEQQIEQQKRVIRFNACFKVAELDDYLPNVPRKSAHHGILPKDILKTMRKALTLADRFVVSTPALAEMMSGLHPDIRVVENHLPLPWWGQVKGLRRQGRKPRVGWGGGAGHRGDLEMIADVVVALADEVEWVFFGMCPDGIRPYVHEFHPGVPIEEYPAKLASLNLDLALAPLEDNLFNQCKSNLRLLELGACGFPVVCSDVRPYQCDLPVTRVKPRFRDWVEAIRMHTHDLDAAAKAGDALREVIHRDWMLDEAHARFWLAQWLPD